VAGVVVHGVLLRACWSFISDLHHKKKATRYGLLLTDFVRGLARVNYDDGTISLLLKVCSECSCLCFKLSSPVVVKTSLPLNANI
jgi:hypothetical protein